MTVVVRLALGILAFGLIANTVRGTFRVGVPDHGVVCLDAETGMALWEYFPDDMNFFRFQIYQGHLAIMQGHGRVIRLDVRNGQELSGIDETKVHGDTVAAFQWPQTVTVSGNQLVFDHSSDRAITVLKEKGPEILQVIPIDDYYENMAAVNDLIVLGRGRNPLGDRSNPTVLAIDSNSGERMWTLDDVEATLGVSAGNNCVYIFEEGAMRALDVADGKTLWRQQLPRVRGWSSAYEQDGRLVVDCDDVEERSFLYGLDAKTGRKKWSFDPACHASNGSVVLREGRVYTFIGPTPLSRALMDTQGCTTYENRGLARPVPRRPACLRDRFADRSLPEIELELRTWHVLGDRSLLPALRESETILADGPLKVVPAALTASFPSTRNPMAMLSFLKETAAQSPDLRPEIRRILDEFEPYSERARRANAAYQEELVFLPELEPNEQALVEAFRSLRTWLDNVPVTEFNTANLHELIDLHGKASFESLVAAHDAASDPLDRALIRMALYAQHPLDASDWALAYLSEMNTYERSQWVHRAPLPWLREHDDLILDWLTHEDRELRDSANRRLRQTVDPSASVSLCTKLLEYGLRQAKDRDVETLLNAMRALARTKDLGQIPLLRRYVTEEFSVETTPQGDRREGAENVQIRLRNEAEVALKSLGADVPRRPPVSSITPTTPTESLYERASKLVSKLERAEFKMQQAEAQDLARELLALLQNDASDYSERDRAFATAYRVLQQWDLAIEHTLAYYRKNPEYGEQKLVRLYESAGRLDDLETLLARTSDMRVRSAAALALIHQNRFEQAQKTLARHLEAEPNYIDACIGLALIDLQQDKADDVDRLMDRAIALRPGPFCSQGYEDSLTYWLKRGQPEKAVAWLCESIRIDRVYWDHSNLFDWVAQFEEFRETLGELRTQPSNPKSN